MAVSLALGACAQTPAPSLAPAEAGRCGVDDQLRMRHVGKKLRAQDRDEIRYEAGARLARILRPDDAATMGMREDRLNIRIGDDGRIDALDCG